MSGSIKRICHISTAHPRNDVRIFYKECRSLSTVYSVCLLIADGKGGEIKDGVQIVDVGKRNNSRIRRIIITAFKAYRKAVSLDCDLYHFHDPEFLFYGFLLAKKGKKVIYDVHEDVPKQTLSKEYIYPLFRKFIASLIGTIEKIISPGLSSIITVTDSINNRFLKWNNNCVIIGNFPDTEEIIPQQGNTRNGICYIGNISSIRGIDYIMDSLEFSDVILHLAGEFETNDYREKIQSHKFWHKVKYYGSVDLQRAMEIIQSSVAGLVTYLPFPNHIEAQPNKMFEYMACGTPVIASDFPLWKSIIETNHCGICVNPTDPRKIAEGVNSILKNPVMSGEMGNNGQRIVKSNYNWKTESNKLKELYSVLLQK
jgi:glycosyltransferase involved in cell wall biosynthesis